MKLCFKYIPLQVLAIICFHVGLGQNTSFPFDFSREVAIYLSDDNLPLYTSIKPYQPGFDSNSTLKYSTKKFWQRFFDDGHLVDFENKKSTFYLNPIINVQTGVSMSNNIEKQTWHFGRGIEGGALLNGKWQLNFSIVENQSKYPAFIDSFSRDNYKILPGLGLVKKSSNSVYDYSYSNGFLRWIPNSKFSATLGHGQHFIGEGYRSLFLSDNAYNYPYLQLNLNTNHVHYMVLFSQYSNLFKKFNDTYQRKWSAINYLNVQIAKRLQLGLFQGVIWQDRDSSGKRGFDVQYLIPTTIIRPIEFSQGSADNTFLGIHANYKIQKNTLAYLQFFLDDINIKESFRIKEQHLNNKYSFQIGVKGYETIKRIKFKWRSEYNYSRPYTYGHRKIEQSYTHYQQAIAHPIGANFHEIIFGADFLYNRWYFTFLGQYAIIGREDGGGINDGNNLFGGEAGVPEFGARTLQGDKQKQISVSGTIGFILNKSWRTGLELNLFYKDQQSVKSSRHLNTTWIQIGIVTRLRNQYLDF